MNQFTFVTLYALFYVLWCMCQFSMSGLCPWMTFFLFPLKSWCTWLLLHKQLFWSCRNISLLLRVVVNYINHIVYPIHLVSVSGTYFFICFHSLDFITLESNFILYLSSPTLPLQTSLDTPVSDPTSSLYRFVGIILDIGFRRLFKPIVWKVKMKKNDHFSTTVSQQRYRCN